MADAAAFEAWLGVSVDAGDGMVYALSSGLKDKLKALYAKIKATVVKDGLKWSEGLKLVDVAFGVQKVTARVEIES